MRKSHSHLGLQPAAVGQGGWMLIPFQDHIILEVVYKVMDGLKNQGICHFSKNRLVCYITTIFVKMNL